jgi:hypothetical protein
MMALIVEVRLTRIIVVTMAAVLFAGTAAAKGPGGSPAGSSSRSSRSSVRAGSASRVRGAKPTARSSKAKRAFERSNPCPSTGKTRGACPGYAVDHVTPLKRGDADDPSNMQWQTTDAAKAKDRVRSA